MVGDDVEFDYTEVINFDQAKPIPAPRTTKPKIRPEPEVESQPLDLSQKKGKQSECEQQEMKPINPQQLEHELQVVKPIKPQKSEPNHTHKLMARHQSGNLTILTGMRMMPSSSCQRHTG